MGNFLNQNRVTILPAVSASGHVAPPLFVFKGVRVPYRVVERSGHWVTETFSDYLPRHSVFGMRAEGGGVDTGNFYVWCTHFVKHVADLTSNNRKVLLILDGYRCHMSVRTLEMLNAHGVIVYALPAHTSGKTQPLDVTVFSSFKNALNEAVNLSVSKSYSNDWDVFSFCSMLTHAFNKAFTAHNITTGFRRAGIWPFDASQLLGIPRPQSSNDADTMVSVSELERLLELKRAEMRHAVLGEDATITDCGFIDTSKGAVLTSERALYLAKGKMKSDASRRLQRELKAAAVAEKAAARDKRHVVEGEEFHAYRWSRRAALAGVSVSVLKGRARSMNMRRAVARRKALQRKRT